MPTLTTSGAGPLVVLGHANGITLIPAATPLTRLNYFDGKFLRADDLQAEQGYLRRLVELSNQAGGAGIVHGFDLRRTGGDRLAIGPGLAIDPEGRVLLLPQDHEVSIATLIDTSRDVTGLMQAQSPTGIGAFAACEIVRETPPTALAARSWYLVAIAHAEALCGQEDVYGKLCEEACATSTDRPYRVEGIVLRVHPLTLATPLVESSAVLLSARHLRSRIASAFYADERARVGSLISGAGLRSEVWCAGATSFGGGEVPLGVLVREGDTTLFVDEWIARRERIDTPPKRYWQWRMAMRPWDVYLAQILQFQCQLRDQFSDAPATGDDDPCKEARALVAEAADRFELLTSFYKEAAGQLVGMTMKARSDALAKAPKLEGQLATLASFKDRLVSATQGYQALPQNRLLINRGIVELPPAGYLPVAPGQALSVNDQVRRFMGEGVDLRFCIVRPDFVAHALEEVQHMERISLLEGLDHPERKPNVDVLVPNGTFAADRVDAGRYYEMRLNVGGANLMKLAMAIVAARRINRPVAEAPEAKVGLRAALAAAAATDATPDSTEASELDVLEFSGAARADAPPGGGIGFHYAGATRSFTIKRDLQTGGQDSIVAMAVTPAASSPRGARPVQVVQALVMEGRSSIWCSMEIDRDPTQLARGQAARVKWESYIVMSVTISPQKVSAGVAPKESKTSTIILQTGFTGEVEVEDVDTRAGSDDRSVSGSLSGELTARWITDSENETSSTRLSEPVRVRATSGKSGPTFLVEMPKPSVLAPFVAELEVRRQWDTPTQAGALGLVTFAVDNQRLAAGDTGKAKTLQIFRAWQTVNPAVREASHPAHELAIRALRIIGQALDNAKFANVASARLFPAPVVAVEPSVLATLDWVLFHRRRDKLCQQERVVAPIETRRYALYHVRQPRPIPDTGVELKKVLEKGGDALKQLGLDFIQVVEFGAAVHAVVSSHTQLRAGWRQDVGADEGEIVGGVIASRGLAASEGERLAEDRIESVVDVLRGDVPVATDPKFSVMNRVPDGLDAVQNDGVIVLATLKRREVVTNCHDVFGVPHKEHLNALAAAAKEGKLEEMIVEVKAKALGQVKFTGTTAQAADITTVKGAWPASFGPAAGALVVFAKGDAKASTYPDQSAILVSALGGSSTAKPDAVESPKALPACPAISIIVGTQQG